MKLNLLIKSQGVLYYKTDLFLKPKTLDTIFFLNLGIPLGINDTQNDTENNTQCYPVDLKSLDELDIDDLNYEDYNIFVEEERLYDDNSETLFSVYEDEENILLSGNLNDLKHYLKSGGFCDED